MHFECAEESLFVGRRKKKRDIFKAVFVGFCGVLSESLALDILCKFASRLSGCVTTNVGEKASKSSKSSAGRPSETGAEVPLNHPLRRPFELSGIFILPFLSPVNVGRKSKSGVSLTGERCGDL